MKNKKLTADVALIAMFTALTAICSWISFPFFGIPVSLQTFAIFVTAGVLGAKKGTISVLIYTLLGIIGAPVFTGFKSGATALFSPTGGYILGFIFTVFIAGILLKKLPSKARWSALAMGVGQIICYISGALWYSFVFLKSESFDFKLVLSVCVAPFIIPDIIKIIAAIILSNTVKRVLKKQNIDIN